MQKIINKGFTLIELLVVIAIIGILAAIVLVSLGNARTKGANAGIQANLDTIRTQMEVFASNNGNTYNNACADPTISAALNSAASNGPTGTTVDTVAANAGSSTKVTCHATSTTNWVVQAPYKDGSGFWCVDSTGFAGFTAANTVAANDGSCN